MTGSTLIPDELKEFFSLFDAIFLNIYPNFIDEFNSLLKEEEKIIPKADDILTPELRVFALIRLGITDSSKIASFLHYSPQTVYNYKLKIRNKLLVSKDEFSVAMQQIGK
jgi:DNA-binding NarL/FixJ family response regulator